MTLWRGGPFCGVPTQEHPISGGINLAAPQVHGVGGWRVINFVWVQLFPPPVHVGNPGGGHSLWRGGVPVANPGDQKLSRVYPLFYLVFPVSGISLSGGAQMIGGEVGVQRGVHKNKSKGPLLLVKVYGDNVPQFLMD